MLIKDALEIANQKHRENKIKNAILDDAIPPNATRRDQREENRIWFEQECERLHIFEDMEAFDLLPDEMVSLKQSRIRKWK